MDIRTRCMQLLLVIAVNLINLLTISEFQLEKLNFRRQIQLN